MEKIITENEKLVEQLETIKAIHEGQIKQITNEAKISQESFQNQIKEWKSKYEGMKFKICLHLIIIISVLHLTELIN